jgi:hypothetical protein
MPAVTRTHITLRPQQLCVAESDDNTRPTQRRATQPRTLPLAQHQHGGTKVLTHTALQAIGTGAGQAVRRRCNGVLLLSVAALRAVTPRLVVDPGEDVTCRAPRRSWYTHAAAISSPASLMKSVSRLNGTTAHSSSDSSSSLGPSCESASPASLQASSPSSSSLWPSHSGA